MNVETKVKASSGTAAIVLLAMYALDQWSVVAAMPGAVHAALQVVVGTGLVFAAGYAAKHTPRASVPAAATPPAPAAPSDAGHADLIVTVLVAAAVAVLVVVLLHH